MPELPEVQALVAELRGRLAGRVVDRLELVSFAALRTFEPAPDALAGRKVTGVQRHGKFLDLRLGGAADDGDELHLLVHLAKAGWLRWRATAPGPRTRPGVGPLAARLVLTAGGGFPGGDGFDLTEAGTRKSLGLWIVRRPEEVPLVAQLGPDPMDPDFDAAALGTVLAGAGRARIKNVLKNQRVIAGIGNAYSDEILHAARMSPFKSADMPQEDVARLFAAMRETLDAAMQRVDGLAATELKREKKSNLAVHGRAGQACPVCGDTVHQVIYADSTFEYCPTCQTGGKPLADRVLSRLLK